MGRGRYFLYQFPIGVNNPLNVLMVFDFPLRFNGHQAEPAGYDRGGEGVHLQFCWNELETMGPFFTLFFSISSIKAPLMMLYFSSLLPSPAPQTRSNLLCPLYQHRLRRFSILPPSLFRFSHRLSSFQIRAIDAAQPFDYEGHLLDKFTQSTKLKIAIIGFGNFGQFLAKTFVRQGHTVLAHSRSNYLAAAQELGVSFYNDPNDLCEQHPDVMLISTSIFSTKSVLKSLPLLRLRRDTLFVDVLSVKEFPKNVFVELLPDHFDILCTHPMFGPESGKESWKGLPFVFDKVRIGYQDSREVRVQNFLNIFEKEGCRMVEMSCAEHDKYAAGSQFITHTVGRVLEKLGLETTPINTKGYETLLDLVRNTASDSFDLYYALFMFNTNSMEQLERLDLAFESVKKEMFGRLHEVSRKQLFGNVEKGSEGSTNNGLALPPSKSETLEVRNNSASI